MYRVFLTNKKAINKNNLKNELGSIKLIFPAYKHHDNIPPAGNVFRDATRKECVRHFEFIWFWLSFPIQWFLLSSVFSFYV